MQFPELAIVPEGWFAAAQQRLLEGRRLSASRKQKHHYLLTGMVQCVCGISMQGRSAQQGKYIYYSCNSKTNKRHLTACRETMLNGRQVDAAVWTWVKGILDDENNLEQGLRKLRDARENDLEEVREKMAVIDELLEQHKRKIERFAKAFGDEEDEVIGASIQQEMRATKRGYDLLKIERNQVELQVSQSHVTETDITRIRELAARIRGKLEQPSFEMKRKILNLLSIYPKSIGINLKK